MRCLIVLVVIGCSNPAAPPATPTKPGPRPPVVVEPATPPNLTPPGFRLPGDVRPVKYSLDLTLVPDQPTATGKMHIEARVMRPTSVVWLHSDGLTIAKAELGGVPAKVIPGEDGMMMIGLVADRELGKGELAIDIAYTAPMDPQKSRGIYTEKEGTESYAYTFFEAIDARRAFPCFDEPAYKVPWQLTFHVKQDHVALANAPVVRESEERDGMKRVEIAVTKPLPSYLVAFVVGPFEVIDGGLGGRAKTPIRFIIPKGRAGELGWAKQVTPRVVAALENYFDMDYPFGKLDVAVVPRFWGTMEHPGIVAMGQPLTLIRPEQETRSRKERYANILAHELAHYWFGDLVTMVWWDDTWLNEALGQWMDLAITDAVEPKWRLRDAVGLQTWAMTADETLSAQSMRQPVVTNEGIAASFDGAITYSKGASVFRMFETFVGEPVWRDFIREYIRAHLWGNATADDLLGLARTKLGPNIEAGLRSFIEQAGAPKITAKITCEGTPKITVRQTRSLPVGITDAVGRTWRVPVCIRYGTTKAAAAKCVQLEGEQAEIASELAANACPTWIIGNAGATGYYRSVADPVMTKALLTPASAIAKIAKPTPVERIMLVADLRATVERGELPIEQALALVPVVAADPDDKVAVSVWEAASFRGDTFDDALYAKAQRFYLASFGPRAKKLGWKRAAGDSDERHDLRRAFTPMVSTLEPTLGKQAEQLADAWLKRFADPKTTAPRTDEIADDLVDSLLYAAAHRGGMARYEQLLAAVKHARDRSEKQRLLAALGNFRDPAIAAKALELVRGTDYDLRDSLNIVYNVMYKRETRNLGFAFVQQHIDELLGRMRDDEASWFLGALASGPCDAGARAAVDALVTPRAAKYDGAQAIVTRGLEQADQCIASLARQLPALKKFLARY